MKKKFVFYMVAAALAMALAGCSSEDDDIDDWIKGIKEELRATEEAERFTPGRDNDWNWMRHVPVDEDRLFSMIREIRCVPDLKNGPADDIVGLWKMVGIYKGMAKSSTDYSCGNIVWNFREDGTVSIEDDTADGIKGNFSYRFVAMLNFCPLCGVGPNLDLYPVEDEWTVGSRGIGLFCRVLKNTMVLWVPQGQPVEGRFMVLVRIQ